MSQHQNGHPGYIVTAARLGAWQRYLHECNGKDIAPEEYMPLQGRDIYTRATNGIAQALRNLTASGENRTDALRDRWGNRYEFAGNLNVPLGDSLLRPGTMQRDIETEVPDDNGNVSTQTVRLLARTHGSDHMGPVVMQVSDAQNIEDLLESMEWRTILALSPQALRLRQFHLSGEGKTLIDINGKHTRHWRLFRAEVHDNYPYPELEKQVGDAVRQYMINQYNVKYSKAAAQRACS